MNKLLPAERWLLPDGVEEILPPRSRRIEALRRRILDRFDLWGYQLVFPPLIEYLDSLLVGVGSDLDLQTFKVTDQLSGRMLGVRADITSQAARIDAHSLRDEGPTRLCYAGTTLRTRPESLFGSRSPIRVGAELFGVAGPPGDAEVLALMAETLAQAGVAPVHVELGHVAIYRSLAAAAQLDQHAAERLFDAVQRKAAADIEVLLAEAGVEKRLARMLRALPDLLGSGDVLERARCVLDGAPGAVTQALDELEATTERMRQRVPGLEVGFDLAELHGYNYHTGTVFSAYAPDHGRAIARGGRYDDIGGAFGRARPATGFDADLKVLADLAATAEDGKDDAEVVHAPVEADLDPEQARGLYAAVAELRGSGVRVITGVGPGRPTAKLVWNGGKWEVRREPSAR